MPRPLIVLLIALLVGACVPAESEENLGKRWDLTTVMGELQERGVIRVGLASDSDASPSSDTAAGDFGPYGAFSAELAQYLADTLKIDLETVEVPEAQMQTGLDTGDIDIAFPLTTITERAVRTQAFSDPHFVSHQRILAPSSAKIEGLDDLQGLQVCAVIEDGIGLDPSLIDDAVEVTVEDQAERCLDDPGYDAYTAPDVVLLAMSDHLQSIPAYRSEPLEITGDQLTTQGFGILTETGANAWVDYLSQVIEEWKSSGGWLASYERHFGDAFTGDPKPADLTVEEAAALFPAD